MFVLLTSCFLCFWLESHLSSKMSLKKIRPMTESETRRFIQFYVSEETLFDGENSRRPHFKAAKAAARQRIADAMNIPGLNELMVAKKISGLRCSYASELRRFCQSQFEADSDEELYEPKWKYFDLLDPYLRPVVSEQIFSNCVQDIMKQKEMENKDLSDSDTPQLHRSNSVEEAPESGNDGIARHEEVRTYDDEADEDDGENDNNIYGGNEDGDENDEANCDVDNKEHLRLVNSVKERFEQRCEEREAGAGAETTMETNVQTGEISKQWEQLMLHLNDAAKKLDPLSGQGFQQTPTSNVQCVAGSQVPTNLVFVSTAGENQEHVSSYVGQIPMSESNQEHLGHLEPVNVSSNQGVSQIENQQRNENRHKRKFLSGPAPKPNSNRFDLLTEDSDKAFGDYLLQMFRFVRPGKQKFELQFKMQRIVTSFVED